jgi:hypothetical protein
MRQRVTGRLVSADDTRITIFTNTTVAFQRRNVQRVELVVGDPQARQRSILKGLGYGAVFVAIWTVNGLLGGWQGFDEQMTAAIVTVYTGSLSGGAAYGALKSRGKGAKYVRIYEKP